VRAVLYSAALDLRRRWRVWLSLALLLGLAGAAVMGAAAGARRTASAYPRLVEDTNAFDILVNPDEGDMDFEPIEALPQVAEHAQMAGALVLPADEDGGPDWDDASAFVFFTAHDDRALVEVAQPKMFDGRLPRPDRVDEALVAKSVADAEGLEVGDQLTVFTFTEDDLERLEAQDGPPPTGTEVRVRVVGIGLLPEDTVVAESDRLPAIFLTHAFHERYQPPWLFKGSLIKLRGGESDIAPFVGAAQRIDGDQQVYYQTQRDLLSKASRAARPYWGALAVFAAVAGFAGLLIIGQAIGRQLFLESGEFTVVRALGMSRWQLLAGSVGRVAVTGVVAAVVAVAGAVATSPLMPIGPARTAEPDPGVMVDATVFGIGAPAVVVLLLVACALPAWRAATGGIREQAGRSRVAEATVAAGLPAPAVAGIRMALERGRGRTAVPVRATVAGAVVAVTALTAALTFAVSLDHLLETPRLYGGDWDASVLTPHEGESGEEYRRLATAVERMETDDDVAALGVGRHAQFSVNSVPVPAVALEAEGRPIFPTVVAGRAPRGSGELLLGASSLARSGAAIGDEVTVDAGGRPRPMRVVGEAVFPRFSAYPGADKTGLGEGAAVTIAGLESLTGQRPDPDEPPQHDFALVRFANGVEPAVGRAALLARLRDIGGEGLFNAVRVDAPERPDDILGYEDVSGTPVALAGLLAVLAGATTAHALVSAVRRRRAELAVLKTLGFLRGQVRATVVWQATTIAVIALLLGLPLGVAAGRWGWTVLAERMHAVAAPVTPLLALALLVPATIVIANLMAALPARAAARTEPAVILRTE